MRPALFTSAWVRRAGLWAAGVAALMAAVLLAGGAPARTEEEEPAVGVPRVVVRLVTSDGKLVSDLESIHPVTRPVAVGAETRLVVLGERCTLWVRNASVDGKWRFERYHEGKYVGRRAELSIETAKLGAGEHVINPGAHKFRLDANGKLASDDPEIQIRDNVLSLRCHRVDIFPVDGGRKGPPESRLVPAKLGLVMPDPEFKRPPVKEGEQPKAVNDGNLVMSGNLPDPQTMLNLLSHSRDFYPLSVYLPSSTVGYGYCLYPSWQTFRMRYRR